MGSMDTLVEDLLRKPRNSLRDELVKNALAGRYHDFKTTLAAPKVQLVADCQRFGYDDIARKAMRGDYDDEPDAADAASMPDLAAALSPENLEVLKQLAATMAPDGAETMGQMIEDLKRKRQE